MVAVERMCWRLGIEWFDTPIRRARPRVWQRSIAAQAEVRSEGDVAEKGLWMRYLLQC